MKRTDRLVVVSVEHQKRLDCSENAHDSKRTRVATVDGGRGWTTKTTIASTECMTGLYSAEVLLQAS